MPIYRSKSLDIFTLLEMDGLGRMQARKPLRQLVTVAWPMCPEGVFAFIDSV